ncbi:hypothetical protein ACWEP3_29595, partial [Streptomyces albidoflavus]
MLRNLVRGLIAGAAGTTVLDAVTYGDMAYRGRGSSGAPGEVVERLAEDTGHPVPGEGSGHRPPLGAARPLRRPQGGRLLAG